MSTPDLGRERMALADEWTHFQHLRKAEKIARMNKPDEDWFVRTEIDIINGALLIRALGVIPANVV